MQLRTTNRLSSRPVRLLSAAASGGLIAVTLTACQPLPHAALVVGDGSRVAISQPSIKAGKDSFVVAGNNKTPGGSSNVTLFQLKGKATGSRVAADLRDEFNQTPAIAAKGTRELVRDINALGLADVSTGAHATVTVNLSVGTYYLMDLGNFSGAGNPIFTPLRVTPGTATGPLHGQFSVQATGADRFVAPNTWPHAGTYLFTNTATDTLHFMDLERVKPGTTDAQVQAFFNSKSQGPPPFAFNGPSVGIGNDVVSPGKSIQVSYNLPAGTYVLLCFVADPTTGLPHAVMGMHKVITLT